MSAFLIDFLVITSAFGIFVGASLLLERIPEVRK